MKYVTNRAKCFKMANFSHTSRIQEQFTYKLHFINDLKILNRECEAHKE